MPDRRHKQIERLFQKAAELPPADRRAFLEAECDDAEVRGEVEKLLAYDQAEGGGLTDHFDDRILPTRDLRQSAPGRGDVPLGVSPLGSSTDSIDHGRFLPGTVLSERFRIVGLLGKGGMGEVYRADDLELGQSVALKFLPKRLADEPHALERFRGEVRLARQVSHPNVCRVYDIGQIGGEWFLSMEYVDGEDLAQLLTRVGRFNPERATELARQLCLGLHAAHEKGVLHRDLKPANIMIDGRGKLLITDFGLAEIADNVREDDIRSGTPAYMSPEQLAGREVTDRSDIYSLGIILHEIFTGKPVWEAGSMAELFEKRRSGTAPTPSSHVRDLDPAVESVVQRCLDPDPAKRPASAVAVTAALPGGDPLAAALAAGETPSPQMVANSGEKRSLSIKLAVSALGMTVVALFLNLWWSDYSMRINRSPLDYEPAVLLDEIEEMISDEFGYAGLSGESAHGFRFFPDISDQDEISFWYRRLPQGKRFNVNSYWSEIWGQFSWMRPGFWDPPQQTPGELNVVFSGNKLLLYLNAVPDQRLMTAARSESERRVVWSEWFTPERTGFFLPSTKGESPEPGFDLERFQVLEMVEDRWWRPPGAYDSLCVWRGQGDDGSSFLVEAAAYRGNPTYFRKLMEEDAEAILRDAESDGGGWPLLVLFLLAVVFGIFLAWYNLWTGRADLKGALRIACYIFGLNTLTLICMSRLSGNVVFIYGHIFQIGMSYVVFSSARLWVWYMALEPSVRRTWPQILISFSRVLDGRFWDPLVGKHLLFGVLFGAIGAWTTDGNILFHDWFSTEMHRLPQVGLLALGGMRELFGTITAMHFSAVSLALLTMLLLLIWRLTTRSESFAIVASVGTISVLYAFLVGGDFKLTIFWIGLFGGLMYFVLVRFGLLSLVVFYTTFFLMSLFPMTGTPSKWFFGDGLLIVAFLLAIALFGFYTSIGGIKALKPAAR